jgi:small multidrug resistance pump
VETDKLMKWILLILAITFEVSGTTMMKLSEGFSKPFYSVGIFISYIGSLIFLTLTLQYFEVSTVYAIWSGLGISIITIIGILYFSEKVNSLKILSLILIIIGVIGLNMTRK